MRIDTGQHMRIDQRMKLAPRMIQSMEILQMSQQALEERIEQELVSNPTIELREPGADAKELEQERTQEARDDRESERELLVHEDGKEANNVDDFERLTNISEEYGESWDANTYETGESYQNYRRVRSSGDRDTKMDAMANTAARSASLYEQLMDQWRLVEVDKRIFRAGEVLIGFFDADGYLRTDMQAVLKQAPAEMTEEDLHEALGALQQSLDPPGLGARDIRECLLLQMDAKEAAEAAADFSAERLLVGQYLKDIEANRLPRISKATGLTLEQIKAAIGRLRQFTFHPGKLLADDSPQAITPDAVVEYDEQEDRYVAYLASGGMPALHLNRSYERMAKDAKTEKKTRDFIGQNLRSARWLIDAISQRNSTLLRVIQVVTDAQRAFFEQGMAALKPLPMTQVADQLGIHVATVSRAVHEKYLQTPRGIFALRMFFSGGTDTESGDAMSWAAIQAKLEQIIEEEDKSKPLNDDELVEKLKEAGIEIARRTVAKYRKQLNIPPARQRREY